MLAMENGMEPVMDTCAGTRIGNFMSLTGTEFGYFLKRGMTTMIGTMIGTGMEYRIELWMGKELTISMESCNSVIYGDWAEIYHGNDEKRWNVPS